MNNDITITHFRSADLYFDLALGVITNAQGESQRVSPVNLKLLICLHEQPGAVLSRNDIFERVWPNQIVADDVLTRAISDIRAQLSQLDSTTKYIETIPKRGYRWVQPRITVDELLPNKTDVIKQQAITDGWRGKPILLSGIVGLVLALVCMWMLSRPTQHKLSLVVLPGVAESAVLNSQSTLVDRQILQALRNNPKIRLVSGTAIASRPANPFPYFYTEFGAVAVLENRIRNTETGVMVELNLVDARTGLEIRSLSLESTNNVELFSRLARLLEYELWQDGLPD